MNFEARSIRNGKITCFFAIIANFIPPVYMYIRYGVMPSLTQLLALWGLLAATYFFSWLIQPISYFPVLGTAGTYMSFVAGAVADVRIPAISMAQKVANVESRTEKGDALAAMAVACSVIVTFLAVTIFTFVGAQIIPLFPKFVTDAFAYILPALFASVYTDSLMKNKLTGVATLAVIVLIFAVYPGILPGGMKPLFCVIGGGLVAYSVFRSSQKKENAKADSETK